MVKDSGDPVMRRQKREVPGLLGMNILQRVKQEAKNWMDHTDSTSVWADVLQFSSQQAGSARLKLLF